MLTRFDFRGFSAVKAANYSLIAATLHVASIHQEVRGRRQVRRKRYAKSAWVDAIDLMRTGVPPREAATRCGVPAASLSSRASVLRKTDATIPKFTPGPRGEAC